MALIEFRSKAAAGFYMMPASFSQVCKVWGRGYSEQGSIPPEDLPDLITKLEAVVKLEKERLAEEKRQQELEEKQSSRYLSYAEEDEREKKRTEAAQRVPFSVRVYPLLEMMKKSQDAGVSIMWGVP